MDHELRDSAAKVWRICRSRACFPTSALRWSDESRMLPWVRAVCWQWARVAAVFVEGRHARRSDAWLILPAVIHVGFEACRLRGACAVWALKDCPGTAWQSHGSRVPPNAGWKFIVSCLAQVFWVLHEVQQALLCHEIANSEGLVDEVVCSLNFRK